MYNQLTVDCFNFTPDPTEIVLVLDTDGYIGIFSNLSELVKGLNEFSDSDTYIPQSGTIFSIYYIEPNSRYVPTVDQPFFKVTINPDRMFTIQETWSVLFDY